MNQSSIVELPLAGRIYKNVFALIDADNFEWLSRFIWYVLKEPDGSMYAVRRWTDEDGVQRIERMHRMVMGAKKGQKVDHRNRKPLHNYRENLRLATSSQNSCNRGSFVNSASQFKGVYWEKRSERWIVRIMANGKSHYIGSFRDEIDAALAHDKSARELHGDFAYINFPMSNEKVN